MQPKLRIEEYKTIKKTDTTTKMGVTDVFFKAKKRQDDIISIQNVIKLHSDLQSLKAELDDHFQSINDNTGEIDVQNSFICEIDNRMNKMEERMDEVHLLLKQLVSRSNTSVELSADEQRVFLQLYTEANFLSVDEIGKKSLMDDSSVEEALAAMMDKGLPVEREILNTKVYFRLNKEFRLRQAKEQVIKIDPEVTGSFQNALLEEFFE